MALPFRAEIADIGAGEGEFTVALSSQVGPGVRVVATEVGRQNVLTLWRNLQDAGPANVSIVEGLSTDTNLPAGSMDAIVLRRTYHHMMQPEEMAASLFRTLRPGGRLFVIEQPLVRPKSPPRDVLARRGGDGIVPEILITELSAAGFRHEKTLDRFAGQLYLVMMLRP
jgi:ubiquinone/menaquinone biosynthesis C-methylase UbiE